MNNLSSNLIVGITSGLVTALLVVAIRRLWMVVIVPWFEEIVYRDAKIEGTWYGSDADKPDVLQYVVSITRTGHAVTGTMMATSGRDKGLAWKFDGIFRNLILTASYGSVDRTRLDRGSMTLMLVRDGQLLKGKLAYYANQSHAIEESDIIFGKNALEFKDKETIRAVHHSPEKLHKLQSKQTSDPKPDENRKPSSENLKAVSGSTENETKA
jgi:hypothetical protein